MDTANINDPREQKIHNEQNKSPLNLTQEDKNQSILGLKIIYENLLVI